MGNSQFSLLRQVIEGQAEKPGDGPPLPPAPSPAPDLSGTFPVAGAPVTPRSSAADESPATPRAALAGPAPRPAAHSGHMKLLFDNAPVAMAMFDTEMRYLLANRRWLEDFKLAKVDITGRSQYDLFPSLHPGWRHVYNRALGGQVVRSDRDAITQDGKRVVYRWEVRPWRHMDTTIGGVTISCERLYQTGAPAEAGEKAGPRVEDGGIWKTKLPLLAVTDKGRILRVSEGLAGSVPDCANEDEPVFFWDAFAEPEMHAQVRRATLVALDTVLSGGEPQASIFTYPVQENEDVLVPSAPIQWLASRLSTGLPGVEGEVALVVGLHGAVPPAKTEPASEGAAPAAVASQEWDQFVAEIARLRQAQKEALDAAALSRQREARLRAVLELAPCGLMVIDEHACAIYQNAQVPGLLGRNIPEGQPIHEWLVEGARDEQHRTEVVRLWTEEIWRKRNAVPVPLTGADGLHREVEMRPVPLPGGGLLLMLQDVTESRRSEEMLRSTEAKFRTLVHENPLPVVLADRSGAVFDVNPACEQLLGHTRAEMRRMPLDRWLDAESLSRRARVLVEMTRRGERYSEFPVRLLHANEYALPVQLRLAVVPDASGQPMFTLHFFTLVDEPAESSGDPISSAPDSPPVSEPAFAADIAEEEEEAPVMKSSAALADAAALMRTFAAATPAQTSVEPEPVTPEATTDEAPAISEEPVQPLFTEVTPAPAAPGVSSDPALNESLPAPEAPDSPDPWRTPASTAARAAFDPWSVPQPPAESIAAADPWRAPQVQSFAPAQSDPWSTPQPPSQPESSPQTDTASGEAEMAGPTGLVSASPLSEPEPPPATTPVQEEPPPIEEIPASVRERDEQTYEVRSVTLLSTDVHGRITAWTGEAEARFGFADSEMIGRGLHSLFRPSDSTGLHIEILSLPGWETFASSMVTWQFFHKSQGRRESAFTLLPLEAGGLALILQEEQRAAIVPGAPESPPVSLEAPAPAAAPPLVQAEVYQPEPGPAPVLTPESGSKAEIEAETEPAVPSAASSQEIPLGMQTVPTASEPTAAIEPQAELEGDDDAMAPPLLLDEQDVPEEWPAVPANLLEDHFAPPVAERSLPPLPVPMPKAEESPVIASPATVTPPPAPVAAPAPAPLALAPPQRMFADTPPLPPKPLSLTPPQSLFRDAAAAATVDASLSTPTPPPSATSSPTPPAPAPEVEAVPELENPAAAPSTLQQRPTFEELQREKLLLGETHHRVKNHLQIITSMLNLQMSTLHNEEARDALRSSQNRVRSIAALHQHLYLLTTGESADFRAFATGLIKHLRECYQVPTNRVSLVLQIPDRSLPEEWLMPLALALNEMVSNAFKHAWPDGRRGAMSIVLTCGETPAGAPHGRLTVTDDGVGLSEDFEHLDHPGMGMKILRVFAGQLGGEVRTRPGNAQGRGVSFELVFPVPR